MKIYSTPRWFRNREDSRHKDERSRSFVMVETRILRNAVRRLYRELRRGCDNEMVARSQIYHLTSDIAIQPGSVSWTYGPDRIKENAS